jgi:hypothetical protein
MSLYQLSKVLYVLNREDAAKERWRSDPAAFFDGFALDDEERQALLAQDIGLIYVLGVNGQLLMHYAALCGIAWPDYLQRMRDGVLKYGQVRAGVYLMTSEYDEKVSGV